jgi:hypothetical protein
MHGVVSPSFVSLFLHRKMVDASNAQLKIEVDAIQS